MYNKQIKFNAAKTSERIVTKFTMPSPDSEQGFLLVVDR
jgi:hypothetical protein